MMASLKTDGNKPFVRLSLTMRDNTGMSSGSASLIMLEGIGSREQCFLFISRIVLASSSSVTGLNLVNEDVQVIGTGSVVGVGTSSASITEYIFVTLALKLISFETHKDRLACLRCSNYNNNNNNKGFLVYRSVRTGLDHQNEANTA